MKYLMKKKETRDIYLELFSDIIGIDLTNYILVDNELNSGNNIKDLRLDLLLENGGQIILEFSEEEYALLLENGSVLLNEKDGRIILD